MGVESLWRSHSPNGYRIVVALVATSVGAYFGLYAVMEARHERRLNRAAFKQSTFVDLVTSGHRGAFIAAMKEFGPIQTMEIPPEPHIWPPWKMWDWWGKPIRPNEEPLNRWARHFLSLCKPQLCGHLSQNEPDNRERDVRIDLSFSDLSKADLSGRSHELSITGISRVTDNSFGLESFAVATNTAGVDLRGADLHFANLRNANLSHVNLSHANLSYANFKGANLSHANLSHANLRSTNLRGANLDGTDLSEVNLTYVYWNNTTTWPDGFTLPPTR